MYKSKEDLELLESKISYHEEQLRLLNEQRRELINYLNLNKQTNQQEGSYHEMLPRRRTLEPYTYHRS